MQNVTGVLLFPEPFKDGTSILKIILLLTLNKASQILYSIMEPISSAGSARRHSAASIYAPSRHYSIQPDNDILTTRGQQLPYLLERYSLSTSPESSWSHNHQMQGEESWRNENHDMSLEDGEIGNETFVQTRRGMRLIGENNNPRYKWYALVYALVPEVAKKKD